jgi:hypothetical protein
VVIYQLDVTNLYFATQSASADVYVNSVASVADHGSISLASPGDNGTLAREAVLTLTTGQTVALEVTASNASLSLDNGSITFQRVS